MSIPFKLKNRSVFNYTPPKTIHDTSKESYYDPENKTIIMGGGTIGVLSPKELYKITAHETQHHRQKNTRQRFFGDREKYIKKNLNRKHPKRTQEEELDLREDYASRFRQEQYKIPGTLEYEARQAETKSSPGLLKIQKNTRRKKRRK
jgi:hypothetical protein